MLAQKWRKCSSKPEYLLAISFYTKITQPDSPYTATTWFQGSKPAQPKSLSATSLYTTLVQPNFHCICKTWFKLSTLAQAQVFIFMVRGHILHYTCTPWFSLHSQNMISVPYNSYCACMFSYIYSLRFPYMGDRTQHPKP